MFPIGNFTRLCPEFRRQLSYKFPIGNLENQMADRPTSELENSARAHAQQFGALVRERREALKMRQDDLALATGVGRRFILELEAGKPSCQLGRALVVAAAVGLRPFDLMSANNDDDNALLPDLDDDLRRHAGGRRAWLSYRSTTKAASSAPSRCTPRARASPTRPNGCARAAPFRCRS